MTEADFVAPEDVEVAKALVTDGLARPAVQLRLVVHADDPVAVRLVDPVPDWDGDGGSPAASDGGEAIGGRVEGTVSVAAGTPTTVTYLLADDERESVVGDGGSDTADLPGPVVSEVVPLDDDDDPANAVDLTWFTPGGDRVPLSVVDGSTHPAVLDPSVVGDLLVPAPGGIAGSERATDDDREASAIGERWAGPDPLDRPAVGVVAYGEKDADSVLGTVLRATDRGFAAFVAHLGDSDDEVVRLSERLGATVVTTEEETTEVVKRALSAAARDAGHPGIVYQTPEYPRIDYERTLAAFARDGFEVEAVPEAETTATETPRVLVAIPAYNAESTIADVVTEALTYSDGVLVVDDGSADGTAERARKAGATVVVHRRNRGYGGALKTAFREATRLGADHVVTLDADGQHDPADIPRLVESQGRGTEVVVGSRYVAGSETRVPLVRAVGLGVVNLLTNLSMGRLSPGRWLRDTQSGYRAYTREAAEALAGARGIGDGMWASTDILYHLDGEGFGFGEVGTTIRYDVENASSEGALGHGVGLVRNIWGVLQHTHPVVLLGIPGIMAVLLATLLGGWTLQQVIAGEPSLGLSLITALSTVTGFTLLFLAILIHTINTHPFFEQYRED